ncbi:methylamine utilization protein [Mariprofundus erugo]|uniref:Methylamine utilization protein n=1 Tax=Mariprofundus erugo TaxID=2528639 RepID=A0A5R9GK58_9PROT|nr:cytochrome c peroxidase [Mariprofundus erugo]TLS66178.1 methylamine utilization protein [Mariprofundus erugo]TLS75110.1 methylamine utilization protein [Mariprofundus erugo]
MKLPEFRVAKSAVFAGFCLFSGMAAQAGDLSDWKLPAVPVPADNPQSEAKVALGHQLAFDPRLSKNDSISCAGCHLPFAGGGGHTPRAFGQGGELGRWAPSWVNAAYYDTLFWDGRASSLEEQTGALPGHMGPISAPGEMGGDVNAIVKRLNGIPAYKKQFNKVFGEDATGPNIAKAIAAFERTLVATDSPFQRYVNGDEKAISPAAKRGFELFQGKAQCAACHSAPLMTDNAYHNISVPQVGPLKEDLGRYEVTKDDADKGAFKTPSLYNSASFTFFMHDGAMSTMEQVIEHYNKGGDAKNPNQDALMTPLKLTKAEKKDLVAFMKTLTDKHLNRIHTPVLP